jgi:hypothetical protein
MPNNPSAYAFACPPPAGGEAILSAGRPGSRDETPDFTRQALDKC